MVTGPHTQNRTPAELTDLAERLGIVARGLTQVAEQMLQAGIKSMPILHSKGVDAALLGSLEPFLLDARRKLVREVESRRRKRKRGG